MPIGKSRSYPERLMEQKDRYYTDTIDEFKQKDQRVMEHLATIEHTQPNMMWRVVNYLLERNEEAELTDQYIQEKSYAGFYYFFKWLSRALFLMMFTTIGNISGKEISCLIETETVCDEEVLILIDISPSITGWILGSILGLVSGQWVGRLVWDNLIDKLLVWYNACSRGYLLVVAIHLYLISTVSFGTIFYFFVPIENGWISAGVGGGIGLVCAVVSYNKTRHTSNVS